MEGGAEKERGQRGRSKEMDRVETRGEDGGHAER